MAWLGVVVIEMILLFSLLQAPVGVGFSYSDSNDYKCNDDRTATESKRALEAFYGMFPEYKSNKFFITVSV